MPRARRLKVKGEIAFYHIMSRIVGQQFLLKDREKEEMLQIITHFSNMYFVEVIVFCIMSNHFHLVIKSNPEHMYSDQEVIRRFKKYILKTDENPHLENREITCHDINRTRKKLEDISEFARSVKQTFSCEYNKAHNRKGYLWGDRFKSVLLDSGDSLLRCCAYVELNPVRAGIVQKPETYRWCSLHYREFTSKLHQFLTFDGNPLNLDDYRRIVYACGNIKRITPRDLEEGRTTDDAGIPISDELSAGTLMLGRIRHFTDGLVIGSKEFLTQAYITFGDTIIRKKDRNIYPTGIAKEVFSIRNLRKQT